MDKEMIGTVMPFQMMHMEIAYSLLPYLPQVKNTAEFLLGSIAPDSVRMNPCYDVAMKVRAHLFEECGQLSDAWESTQNYKQWRRNMWSALCKFLDEQEQMDYRDFTIGLWAHCMTDYYKELDFWRMFQHEYLFSKSLEEQKSTYYSEACGIDLWLYHNSKNTNTIMEMLSNARAFDVEGRVNITDIEKQKEYLLNVQYHTEADDISNYCFFSADMIKEFMFHTRNNIMVTMLSWSSNSPCRNFLTEGVKII